MSTSEAGALPAQVLEKRFFLFETDREVYELFRPRPDVLVLRVLGYSCTEAAVRATAAVDGEVGNGAFSIFVDFTALVGYEPAARRVLASWVTAHAKQVREGWFCTTNKVVEMGISVGSMMVSMVGVQIHVVTPEEWSAALHGALQP